MRKHFKRTLAMLLALVMILSAIPASFATEKGETATLIEGLPADGTYGIILSCGEGYSAAMGYDVVDGNAPAIGVTQTTDGKGIEGLPEGTAIVHFKENSDGTYYFMLGSKYLVLKDIDSNNKEKLVISDTAEKGAKWDIIPDQAGMEGAFNIKNNEYKWNGKYDVYLEQYNNIKFCGYSYKTDTPQYFQFKFYSCSEDTDGRVGVAAEAGALPVDGKTYVIYNDNGACCFGAQSADTTSPSIEGVPSVLNENGTLDIGNGARIYTVHKEGDYYTFENDGKFLRTSPNEVVDGKNSNAECLYMDVKDNDYSYWKLQEITGGYMIVNKTAKYGSNFVSIEYFSNSFSGWTFNGSANLFAMRFFEVKDELDIGYVLNPKIDFKAENAFIGVDYEFSAILDELSKVTEMSMTYAVDGGTAKSLTATAIDGYTYTYKIPSAELKGKTSLTLKGEAKNEYGMTYSAEKTVEIKDEPIIVSVSPMSNAATGSEKQPEIVVNLANCGANPTVTMTVDEIAVTPTVSGNKISYKPATSMTDDRHTVAVTVTREDGKKTEMTWSFFVGEAGMSLYFGQMHSHTAEYSDGAGQLEDAYEHAMGADDVDFLIVTDHSNYFDDTSTATTSSYYDLSSLTKSGSITKWEEAKQTAAEYDAKSDDFVAAYGYEMTWSGGPGHTNTFNTYGTVSRNNASLNNKTGYAGMHLYNDLMVNANKGLDVDGNAVAEGVKTKYIEDAPVVSQLNHPGTTFGTFDTYAGYTPTRDVVINLIEVGNGEGQVGGSSYWPSYSEYDKCLAKGWHVAPTNNQDNHKGKWGDANTCRDVVLTDNFTEAGLYEAMSERRVYATEDQNLRIYYYLNDEIMGTIIDTGDTEVKEVNIVASISDPDGEKLGKIEIIGENGITLKSFDAAGSTYELKTTLPNTDAYYYIKVTQADGDIAVTAPVWVGVATPITASISTDAALCVVGDSEKITVTVDNAAAADYTLSKIELTLVADGKETVVKTIEESAVIEPGKSFTKDIEYIRTVSGTQELKVVFYGTYNGKEFKCRASMEQKVYKADELIKVGIDYGHGNFYVSGGYSDNMGNFIQYCADNGVQAEFIQQGEFTYNNLKHYKMVILTVPFDTGNLAPSAYTYDEITALKKYAECGGNLIITSKSDRKSPEGEMNCANLSNSLLEAIGSNVRVADGIIVDNDLKANEAYRIYFSGMENFNTEHRFTKGAYTASNAFGTIPSPTNSVGFQLYNAAPILINKDAENKVTKLISGYQSTWGASYTANFDGSSYVPNYSTDKVTAEMGDVNIMTYEELPGGGWLIVSGCTFFSNYDIKDDQNYANKHIVQNILRDVTGADDGIKITPISEVKKVPESQSGKQFNIEGYVTSNASAYDQDTAFFDCIYIQDKNGNGINAFPVAGNYAIGMNVRAHGAVTYYCGEIELNLSSDYNGYCRVISDDIYIVQPKEVDCKTAMSNATIGNLMKVRGIVTGIHKTEGVIDKIYVRDAVGEACLFINGYIMKDYTGLDDLKVGMMISGIGIGSRDVDEQSATSAIFSRLRVRNRSEIVILDSQIHSDLLFTDVNEKDWFFDEVLAVVERGLLLGTSTSTFAPNATLTRGMVATVLYRMAGEPKVSAKSSFKDVDAGAWYADPIAWAEENNVVGGYEDNTFRPNNNVTRQEMALMLARYAAQMDDLDVKAEGSLNAFPDGNTVPEWSRDAVIWAVDNGIINGLDGKIAPTSNATRAQFAAIIIRYLNMSTPEPQ